MNNISQRIKRYRRKKGLTQIEVASAMGIRTDNYAKYESGVRIPREDRLVRLAQIFAIPYNTLAEGIEREFVDLLYRHAISAVLGEVEVFMSFLNDMELTDEAYYAVMDFLNKGLHYFAAEHKELFVKYINEPTIPSLIALYDNYKTQSGSCPEGQPYIPSEKELKEKEPNEILLELTRLNEPYVSKWAFCFAVSRYLEMTDADHILAEAEKLSGDLTALQFFAVKVFVPYLSLIADAADVCENTSIDDFSKVFLNRTGYPA